MKIVTWNINGVRARAGELLEWIQREAPDVVCLQEIKASPEQVPAELRELPGYWSYWHGNKGYSGVALLMAKARFPARPAFSHPAFDFENRVVCAAAGDFEIASVYVPNGGKDFQAKLRFLEALDQFAAAERSKRLVICGDLNVAREARDVHPTLRNPEEIGQTPHEQGLLEKVIAHGLSDVLRKHHPADEELFTWWAPWRNLRQRNRGWRIDYVLVSEGIASASCDSFREFGKSDHAPVQAVLDVPLQAYQPAPDPGQRPADPGQLPLL